MKAEKFNYGKIKRKICWPDPDGVCMEGGCTYCNDGRFILIETIKKIARRKGMIEEFNYGGKDNWPNVLKKDGNKIYRLEEVTND